MLKLLIVALASAAVYYGLRASEVPALKRDMLILARDRDGALAVARKQGSLLLMARVKAEREEEANQHTLEALRLMRPAPKVIHPERTYTLEGLLRVTGIQDVRQ